jgi:hypothetical protein
VHEECCYIRLFQLPKCSSQQQSFIGQNILPPAPGQEGDTSSWWHSLGVRSQNGETCHHEWCLASTCIQHQKICTSLLKSESQLFGCSSQIFSLYLHSLDRFEERLPMIT